jgi:hypothetical protein
VRFSESVIVVFHAALDFDLQPNSWRLTPLIGSTVLALVTDVPEVNY